MLWVEMMPTFVVDGLAGMMFLHNVVDVRDGRADEKREDEGDDIVLFGL